ncbi:polyisoprenoid-binding protein [Zoogloea oryzae]|uniref:Polyisoprenoid-binding protein n=1 Tax=Zoogloea oryzae TaxID=310767 RepID=A0ABQ6FCY9_9RHOO|nr:YceI family protein [Zoogloea oryzae]GLT23488.1 polyisoprenoid-binding protein [Zoogloea oryzae]
MNKALTAPLLLALAAVSAPALAAPAGYTVDPNHTFPVFEVDHLGFSTQRGRFNKTSGRITLDTAARQGTVDVTIDATSIDMGFAKWNDNMRGENYFNTDVHPTITFKADRLVFDGERPVSAEGSLTMLGVTRPVTLTINRFRCAPHPLNKRETCGADVVATLKRSEFGMTKYIPSVGDDVRLLIAVEAFRE